MGGSSKKKTVQRYEPPSWVESGARTAIGLGQGLARQRYRAYEGDRVAGLSENERMGMELARDSVGIAQPYYDEAAALTRRGTQQFSEVDMDQYMNPYIKGALDPVAREIREEGQRDIVGLESRAASMDAFGGSRAALARSESREKTLQGIEDLYGKGYKDAWDFGTRMWGEERTRDLEAAGRFQMLGGAVQDAAQTDISTLMTTGATDRGIQQALMDFDYQQWTEERDWGFRQLAGIIAALEGTKGSYQTTQRTTTKVKKDATGDIIGAVGQVAGALIMMYSDERLKDNIRFIKEVRGVNIYKWTWNSIAESLFGFTGDGAGPIAQEHPEHTVVGDHGYLMIDRHSLFGGHHG